MAIALNFSQFCTSKAAGNIYAADEIAGVRSFRPVTSFFDWGCKRSGVRSVPRRESWGSRDEPPSGGLSPLFFPELCPYRCKDSNTK